MKKPNPLEFTSGLVAALADYYEYSMAQANMLEGIAGQESVFDFVVRRLPVTKVVGTFEHEGIAYDKLSRRDFLVNAGLEQAAAYFLLGRGNLRIREHLEKVQGITDRHFLDWAEHWEFRGDVYAMPEGTIFFAQEPQLRVRGRFEEAQVFESLLCNTINPQTNVATTANDIASVTEKILLEGGSRRAGSPQGALFNSRAARIGGFHASSNVAFGLEYGEKVGGTHGHSYVMLHPTEYAAFRAQGKLFLDKVCFLLDTYEVKKALDTALRVVEEESFGHFAFRIDSGNLLSQARWIHQQLAERGYFRDRYTLVASDDLTAGKIAYLEEESAGIDRYLVGTYAVNPPKPLGGVYKLAAFKDSRKDGGEGGNGWHLRGKFSEHPGKATLPGIKQVYRVTGSDGHYKRDIIALEGEDISKYVQAGEKAEPLLVPVIVGGRLVYDFPCLEEISRRRIEQLAGFAALRNYEVNISDGVLAAREEVRNEYC